MQIVHAQFIGPAARAVVVANFRRRETGLWTMLAANVVPILLALLVHRQETRCRPERKATCFTNN